MTGPELFTALADIRIAEHIEALFDRRDVCILTTRIVDDIARYFGMEITPQPVQAVAYNAAYAAHIDAGEEPDIERWRADGSYSVGIGYGGNGGYNGHLVAVCDGWFADFSIWQAERPQRGIHIPAAVFGPLPDPQAWSVTITDGTTIDYHVMDSQEFRRAPDWKDAKRRRRISGRLIRQVTLRP